MKLRNLRSRSLVTENMPGNMMKIYRTFFKDPWVVKRLLAIIVSACFLSISLLSCESTPGTLVGRLEHHESFESNYIGKREVDVWLPPDYPVDAPYAVLYMHDGENLYDASKTWNGQEWGVDEVLTRLIHEDKIKPVIVVSIWNAGEHRRAEYMPQKAFEMLNTELKDSVYSILQEPDQRLFSKEVYSDDYLRFIVTELKPFIDDHYEVTPSRENTFIMGSSMGGLVSMYAMLEYPEIFGGAACLSTHWYGIHIDNDFMAPVLLRYFKDQLMPPGANRWYFDYGTETIDRYYEPYQLKADLIMEDAGYTSENWITRKYEGHKHEENSWSSRLHIPMEFLLK
jgi:enterochelin esterase-like enzyme